MLNNMLHRFKKTAFAVSLCQDMRMMWMAPRTFQRVALMITSIDAKVALLQAGFAGNVFKNSIRATDFMDFCSGTMKISASHVQLNYGIFLNAELNITFGSVEMQNLKLNQV
jgi:hypothetical protein